MVIKKKYSMDLLRLIEADCGNLDQSEMGYSLKEGSFTL